MCSSTTRVRASDGRVRWCIVLVLSVDTSTPSVTSGIVRLGPAGVYPEQLAVRATDNPRAHAEILTPQILECVDEAGIALSDLAAVVVGVGPGPFTGLRVGMVTAAAFADALGIPVHGVCSLDAIAADVRQLDGEDDGADLLVVTDARRREVYWARYVAGRRVEGPGVSKPADLAAAPSERGAGSPDHVAMFELPVVPVTTPSPAGLVSVAAADLRSGTAPEPLVPMYLRRPDAVETAARRA